MEEDDDHNKVPLEPYPAPPLQAIGPEGYEYPPHVVPSAQTFEAMVRRLDLLHHATKKRPRGRGGGGRGGGGAFFASTSAQNPTAMAEKDLAASLQSVEEAMRDLLIAADLVHVVRGERPFLGLDSLTESQSPSPTKRQVQQQQQQQQQRHGPLPVAYIPPEVVLEMKKKSLTQAASEMALWVQQTRTTIDKGRRLIGRVAQLRRTSRLRAGGRNVALARPLLAGDPLSVVLDTKNGPVVLPFEVDSDGTPRIPQQDDERRKSGPLESVMRFRVFNGRKGTSASVFLRRQGAGAGENLAEGVQGLEDEAYLGQLFENLRREAAGPAHTWVDRHGLASGFKQRDSMEEAEEHEMEEEGIRVEGPLQVAEATGQRLMVEIDHLHVLSIEFGDGRDGQGRNDGHSAGTAAAKRNTARPPESLLRLSRLALLRVLELGHLQGSSGNSSSNSKDGILLQVARELAHYQFMDRLQAKVSRIVDEARGGPIVVETFRWLDNPYTSSGPSSRMVLTGRERKVKGTKREEDGEEANGGGSSTFLADLRVEVTSLRLTWTWSLEGGRAATSLEAKEFGTLRDLETYLQTKLLLRENSDNKKKKEK